MSLTLDGVRLKPVDVYQALEALQCVAERLQEDGDPRAIFPDVYGIITREVLRALEADDTFLEPLWLSRLAGRFCEKYLETLSASTADRPQASFAWEIAYRRARIGMTLPVQDALLGITAHINFDLARGLYDNIVAFDATKDERLLRRYRHDHDAVNRILQACIPEILDTLVGRYGCLYTYLLTRSNPTRELVTGLIMRTLERWRSRVWRDLLLLLEAPDDAARAIVIARMNRRSGNLAERFAESNRLYIAGAVWLPASWRRTVRRWIMSASQATPLQKPSSVQFEAGAPR